MEKVQACYWAWWFTIDCSVCYCIAMSILSYSHNKDQVVNLIDALSMILVMDKDLSMCLNVTIIHYI